MSHGTDPRPMTARRSGPLTGVAQVPGDKSISHRALILGALSVGETRITGLLEGQDVLDTAKAMAAFGADVQRVGEGEWVVHGVGVGGFAEPEGVIDCGNSGTGVRLIMGAMATTPAAARTRAMDAATARRGDRGSAACRRGWSDLAMAMKLPVGIRVAVLPAGEGLADTLL